MVSPLGRRVILGALGAATLSAAAGFIYYRYGRVKNPAGVVVPQRFARLNAAPENADWVTQDFLTADFSDLVCTYNNFYPKLLSKGMVGLKDLEDSVRRFSTAPSDHPNLHRLDGLPAVMSTHLLASNAQFHYGEKPLSERIRVALEKPILREIVLQNLIAAGLPSDGKVSLAASETTFWAISSVLSKTINSPSHTHIVFLCAQYLINAKRYLDSEEGSLFPDRADLLGRVRALLELITDAAARNEHLTEVARIAKMFSGTIKEDIWMPQYTETILGSTSVIVGKPMWQNYLKYALVIYSRLLHSHWLIANQWNDNRDEEYIDAEQAHTALEKMLEAWVGNDLYAVLSRNGIPESFSMSGERSFGYFLRMALPRMLDSTRQRQTKAYFRKTYISPENFPLYRFRSENVVKTVLSDTDSSDLMSDAMREVDRVIDMAGSAIQKRIDDIILAAIVSLATLLLAKVKILGRRGKSKGAHEQDGPVGRATDRDTEELLRKVAREAAEETAKKIAEQTSSAGASRSPGGGQSRDVRGG